MLIRHLSRIGLAVAVAAVAATAFAATAQARTSVDPCQSATPTLTPISGTGQSRACGSRFDLPAHRTWTDPTDYSNPTAPGTGCPQDWAIVGSYHVTQRGGEVSPGQWEYWTLWGQWVVWDGGWDPVWPDAVSGLRALRPRYHNWGSWPWPTQTHYTCAPGRPGGAVYRVQAADGDQPQTDEDAPNMEEGTSHDDTEAGTRGDDVVLSGSGDDKVNGGAGADNEIGGKGTDDLSGGTGDDTLQGGPGDDREVGGAGGDQLFDDQGRDTLIGGAGDDRFSARDGDRDVIDCGPGDDIAIGDRHDDYRDCEHVYRSASEDPPRPPKGKTSRVP